MGHNFDVLDWTKQGVIPDKGVNEGAVCGHALPKLPNSVLRVVVLPSQYWLPSHNFHDSSCKERNMALDRWCYMDMDAWVRMRVSKSASFLWTRQIHTAMNLTQERGVWVGKKKKDMGVRVTLHDAKPGAECSPKHCFGLKIHSVDTKITIYFFFSNFWDLLL